MQFAALQEQNHRLREDNQGLKDEVARLKGQKAKPKIGPSRLNEKERKKRRGQRKGEGVRKLEADRTVVVKAEQVPKGSRFKGYDDYWVQELVLQTQTTRYRVEKWSTPNGELVRRNLPAVVVVEGPGAHFGPTLRSFVLYQYYHAQVTEPLILEQPHEWGMRISSGQLHGLTTQGKEQFHREKDEILQVGLRVSRHIHVDDTGARHQGKNSYVTHIGNEWFAWFETTQSKSRINFLELLRAGHTDYVLGGEALEYMVAQKLPTDFSGGQRQRLAIARAVVNSPVILLLDEATSALDNVTQSQVDCGLDEAGCTRIVIAHRLSTVRNADAIVVMDRGRIVETGTHDQLVQQQGLYWQLVRSQMDAATPRSDPTSTRLLEQRST